MKNLLKPFGLFSGVLIGALSGVGSAQAALLVPPPPNSNLTIQAVQAAGAGVNFFLRNNNFDADGNVLTGPGGTYTGFCNTVECSYFDFRPAVGGGDGDVFFSGTQPSGGSSVFQNVVGGFGKIKDVVLPFIGAPINQPNLNLPLSILSLVDANPLDPTNVDTFDATKLRSVIFENTGSGSLANFAFDGFWNILDPSDNKVKQYAGSINFTQALSQTVNQVLNGTPTVSGARQPGGYFAAPSIQANVSEKVPEPSAFAGLVAFAGMATLASRKRKSK